MYTERPDTDMAPKVSPWKAFSRAMILFFLTPRLKWYCSAILMATSTEVDPLSEKNTRLIGSGNKETSFSESSIAGGCVNPLKTTWSRRSSCSFTRWVISGLQCPYMQVYQEAIPSM